MTKFKERILSRWVMRVSAFVTLVVVIWIGVDARHRRELYSNRIADALEMLANRIVSDESICEAELKSTKTTTYDLISCHQEQAECHKSRLRDFNAIQDCRFQLKTTVDSCPGRTRPPRAPRP